MAKIRGTGIFIPDIYCDDDFIERYGKRAEAASKLIGHKTHYSATDIRTGKLKYSNTEMAEKAARNAIEDAGISINDIGMIIYSTCTPDYLLPPAYTFLQKRLGLRKCIGMDIRSGCAGFGTGLTIAETYIEAGKVENVLVVGCDLLSTRFSKLPVETLDLKSLFNYMFFGDGAGAVIVSKSKDKSIRYSEMFSDHAYVDMGSCFYVGGSTNPYISEAVDKDKWGAYQASGLSEKYLSEVLIDTLRGIQDKIEVSLSKIDAFVMPVESEKIKERVLEELPEIQEQRICTSHEGGALINAAVPISLDIGIKNKLITTGKKVIIYAAENTQWQHAVLYIEW